MKLNHNDMHKNRFFVSGNIENKRVVVEDEGIYNQIRNVLRMKKGDGATLLDGEGRAIDVVIRDIKNNTVTFERLGEVYEVESKSRPNVALFCSVLKRENFELVCQKATEIGVGSIHPIICERTVKLGLKKDRLRKIISEAAEQSGRGDAPELYDPVSFPQSLEGLKGAQNILFDASGSLEDIKKLKREGEIKIWIGPEGGWSEEELHMARLNGFAVISLSGLTLRAETAAIIASYLATYSKF